MKPYSKIFNQHEIRVKNFILRSPTFHEHRKNITMLYDLSFCRQHGETGPSETSVGIYHTSQRHNPQGTTLHYLHFPANAWRS